jgi:hypothetical protein
MQNECHRLIMNQTRNFRTAQHYCRVFINPLALVTWETKILIQAMVFLVTKVPIEAQVTSAAEVTYAKRIPTKVISVKREHREAKTTLETKDNIHVTSVTTVTLQ